MKKTSLFILMLVLAFTACQQRLYEKKDQKSITNAVVKQKDFISVIGRYKISLLGQISGLFRQHAAHKL